MLHQEGVVTTCEFRPEYACYQMQPEHLGHVDVVRDVVRRVGDERAVDAQRT